MEFMLLCIDNCEYDVFSCALTIVMCFHANLDSPATDNGKHVRTDQILSN